MAKTIIHARPEDILHITIHCRCGIKSSVEIPKMTSKGVNMFVCSCDACYTIQQHADGNVTGKGGLRWKITRDKSKISEQSFMEVPE